MLLFLMKIITFLIPDNSYECITREENKKMGSEKLKKINTKNIVI